MVKKIGQNINETDEPITASAISIDSTTAVTLLAARTIPLLKIFINNRGNRDLFVRLYPASDDNIKRGIGIESGETRDLLNFVENYTGEISGIMSSGGANDVFVTSL